MPIPSREFSLENFLNKAFDVAYLSLLEADKISLDDDLQKRLRVILVTEVYGILEEECTRMGKTISEKENYFCSHGFREISRRLKQELQEEEAAGTLPAPLMAKMMFLPAFENAEG